jgi:D-lactate dehydrogenase
MEKKIICFGVRDYEKPTFEVLGKKYGYELILKSQYLNDENYEDALGYPIVMVRGNCTVTHDNMGKLAAKGLRYYLTRTAGYNHVDVAACKEFGIQTAFVPGYSPNAISELALTLGMMLLRNTAYATSRTASRNFKVDDQMFSREIRECTVGILGCGRIGYTTGKLFKGLGAKVIAYDLFPNPKCLDVVQYVDLDTFLKESDLISIHMNYMPGKTDKFMDAAKIAMMKKGSILVNCARGELLDNEAAVSAVEKGQLAGLGLDVIPNEKGIFNHSFASKAAMADPLVERMLSLYPRVLITPHLGSATDGALKDMVEVSLMNMEEYLTTGKCKNSLIK